MELKDKKIILCLLMLIIPMKVWAGSVTAKLNCPASADANTEVSCTIEVTPNDSELSGVEMKYALTNATYKSFTQASNVGWTVVSNSSNGVALLIDAVTTKVTVGTLKVTLGTSNASIKLFDINGTNNAYETLFGQDVSKTIRIKSDNNILSSLEIEGATLSPAFSADVTNYTATTENASITINATKENEYATITGTGVTNLNYGSNVKKVEVTSEKGTKKTYTITITRTDNRSSNNKLSSLSIDHGNINFNSDTTTYNITVDGNVDKIAVSAEKEDTKASFVDNYGPRTVNLNYGINKIEIKVKAENETVKTYLLNVTRTDNRSSINTLSNITINPGTIDFSANTDTYNIVVANTVTRVNVTATPTDNKATVTVDNKDLVDGLNVITITVKAENETTKVYTLNITRNLEEESWSTNNEIKRLEIVGHNINFSSDETSYNVTITDEKSLKFNIEMEDDTATYEIEGNSNLKDGSIVKVIVKSQNGSTKEYKFSIKKNEIVNDVPRTSSNTFLPIISSVLLILGCSIVFLYKKKKRKKVLVLDEII